jgi:hypothetical protein
MASDSMPIIEGIPGSDAAATKRGFLYQDLATALAWVRLTDEQALFVEAAEDMAVAREGSADVHQIRDVARPLTLKGALPFLENALQIRERNPRRSLRFIYATTASIGQDRAKRHQVEDMSCLDYWREVRKRTRSADPLIAVLGCAAPPASRLASFLGANTNATIVDELINAVDWLSDEPSGAELERELSDAIVRLAQSRIPTLTVHEARDLLAPVVHEVTKVSARVAPQERVLTRLQLQELIEDDTYEQVRRAELDQLRRDAILGRHLPVQQISDHVTSRLERMVKVRFFKGVSAHDLARCLAADVRDGGICAIAPADLRARVLVWCARMLVYDDEAMARDILFDASGLSDSLDYTKVEALLECRKDLHRGLQLIEADKTPLAMTFRYLARRDAAGEAALSWTETARIVPIDVDADGQFIILWDYLKAGQWIGAMHWLERVPDESYVACPALNWAAALTLVCWAVPEQIRSRVLEGAPIARHVPLKVSAEHLAARRRAVDLFNRFAAEAQALGNKEMASIAKEYVLWLSLDDRTTCAAATLEAGNLWRNTQPSARWLPTALRAGINVDRKAVYGHLFQQGVRFGALDFYEARALLALLLDMPSNTWLSDWETVKSFLTSYFSADFLTAIGVEALLHAGRVSDAEDALARAGGIAPEMGAQLVGLIAEAKRGVLGTDAPEHDGGEPEAEHPRGQLVRVAKRGMWQELESLAKRLFDDDNDLDSAEHYVHALHEQWKIAEAVSFLDANPEVCAQSDSLVRVKFEALFRLGRWQDAADIVGARDDLFLQPRDAQIKLALLLGQWERLGLLLEACRCDSGDASPEQLLRHADVATSLGRWELAQALVGYAVSKQPDDPHILTNAYALAVRGGWEDNPSVHGWLEAAIARSGEHGPVQQMSLRDFLDYAPRWRERVDEVAKGLASGEMALVTAAQLTNQSLASLMLATADSNQKQSDPRHRHVITAYSGVAKVAPTATPRSITLDVTALLTIASLDLLPVVMRAFTRVRTPYATAAWLLVERGKIRFHQPSRIARAHRLLNAIAGRDEVGIAEPQGSVSPRLTVEIGAELSDLVSAAQHDRSVGLGAYVICPAPIHRAGSLMEETADVDNYVDMFRSTLAVVRSLRYHGVISDQECERTEGYLAAHDKGWPDDGILERGATLYLDGLAVSYLEHVEAFNRLRDGGFTIKVHPDTRAEASALVCLEDSAEAITKSIDAAREFLVAGASAGVAHPLPQPAPGRDGTSGREVSGVADLLDQLFVPMDDVEAVVIDDRAVNRFGNFDSAGENLIPLCSTLDVIDWLLSAGAIDWERWMACRTSLRRRGYILIPVTCEELVHAVDRSQVRDGILIESVEARAVRENMLLAQMAKVLRIPDEGAWLTAVSRAAFDAVVQLWSRDEVNERTAAGAKWLAELADYVGFADRFLGDFTAQRWNEIDAMGVSRLSLGLNIPEHNLEAYKAWLQSDVLDDLERTRPDVFDAVRASIHLAFLDMPNAVGSYLASDAEVPVARAAVLLAQKWINDLPVALRNRLIDRDAFLPRFGLTFSATISVEIDGTVAEFNLDELYVAVTAALNGSAPTPVTDRSGVCWEVAAGDRGASTCSDPASGRKFLVEHAPLFARDAECRLVYLCKLADEYALDEAARVPWLDEIASGPLTAARLGLLMRDVGDTPKAFHDSIRRALRHGPIDVPQMVPLARRYFARLLKPWGGEADLRVYAETLDQHCLGGSLADQVSHALLWSGHASTAPTKRVASAPPDVLREVVDRLLPRIDLWSLTGLLEALLARGDAATDLRDLSQTLLGRVKEIASTGNDRFNMTSALVMLVDGFLHSSGMFADAPPFWRRLASISHAALLERAIGNLCAPPEKFVQWAMKYGAQFQATTLVDLRLEPQWSWFFLEPAQLRQELLGRVLSACERHRSHVVAIGYEDHVFGASADSIASQVSVLYSALPGPLEGKASQAQVPDAGFGDAVETGLADASIPLLQRVRGTAHMACLGALPPRVLDQLASAVHDLSKLDEQPGTIEQLSDSLMGLSMAAARSRSTTLADEIDALLRTYPSIPISIRFTVGMTLCAIHEDAERWRAAVAQRARSNRPPHPIYSPAPRCDFMAAC